MPAPRERVACGVLLAPSPPAPPGTGALTNAPDSQMRKRDGTVVLICTLLLAPGLAAAQQGTWERLGGDLDQAVGDIFHVWAAPFRLEGEDLPALIALSEAVLLAGGLDNQIQEWVRTHPRALPVRALAPLRESHLLSKIGYSEVLVPLSAILYAGGLAFDSDELRDAGLGCITSDLANTLSRHALARLIGRLRPRYREGPYVIKPFAFGDWPMRSFPNGHGANIMACVSFWNNRFELGPAEPALYGLAGAVALGRVLDEAHWASDTVFGVAFGWTVGQLVARRYDGREADEPAATPGAGAAPVVYLEWRVPF